MGQEDLLASWNDNPTREAIVEFVHGVTREGSPGFVAPDDRVATFDNDGTLWCEKPMPIELGFVLGQLSEMVEQDPTLRDRQPWKAAHEQDYSWLSDAVYKHYAGDDSEVKVLLGGMAEAFAGWSVEDYGAAAEAFLHRNQHPTLGRRLRDCGFLPMIELLRYLNANGFTSYIASGGDRDFMRSVSRQIYGIPPERVVGTSDALRYRAGDGGGSVVYEARIDTFDDGPLKPVRIWSRVGRRPVVAGGNANGDIPMLRYAGGDRPALRLLVLHDDADREFDYTGGAEQALDTAKAEGWTVVSVKHDWSTVFAE